MNIYLSAQWARRDEIEGYAQQLRDRGLQVTSRWHQGEPMGNDAAPTRVLGYRCRNTHQDRFMTKTQVLREGA